MASLIASGSLPPQFQVPGSEAEGVVELLGQLPVAVQETAKWLYSDSLRAVWIFFIPLAGVAFLASLFMKNLSLDKVLNSKQAFEEAPRQRPQESSV